MDGFEILGTKKRLVSKERALWWFTELVGENHPAAVALPWTSAQDISAHVNRNATPSVSPLPLAPLQTSAAPELP